MGEREYLRLRRLSSITWGRVRDQLFNGGVKDRASSVELSSIDIEN